MANRSGWLATALGGLILAACNIPVTAGISTQPAPPTVTVVQPTAVPPLPDFKHVFVIVMENKSADDVIGNPEAPFINRLAADYAQATNFHGTTHPSLPNYLALTGGDTFRIRSNYTLRTIAGDNLADQVEAAGRTWKAYTESLPEPCFLGDAPPLYRRKHNPFTYYDTIRGDPARCRRIVPFTAFEADLEAAALPDLVWITPNMCNGMHDCSVETGDTWLAQWVPRILASPAWQDQGVLFITFDEGLGDEVCCEHAKGGKIATLVISPLVQPGFSSDVPYDHYSLLRTIETAWGLPLLRKAGDVASTPMADFFYRAWQ